MTDIQSALTESQSSLSARERVYLYLRQQITTGEYAGGKRLTEEEIAEEVGLSRTPIREALQRMVSEGLVQRIRRGHLVVVEFDDQARLEQHKLRVAFDQVAAELLTAKFDRVSWDLLYDMLIPLEECVREQGVNSPQYAIAHLDFHMSINRAAFSSVTSAFFGRQPFLYPTEDYVQQSGHEPISQHRTLLDELSSGDLERARTAMRVHALRGHGNTSLD